MACPIPRIDHGTVILLLSAGAGLGMAVLMALGFRRPPSPDDG